ncbi:hypothetical protein HMPREF1321_0488 [Capnocytophaga sp. oral taxon 412 str. F0487]|uniref:hypothetical protein n=1 Tax=Capnocytophaga sp. oral taxon 412 TaxID=712218 RepID=UPI000269649B|nr:hypothetical protein [Capnocytophaga sp. oral taxon 412]EIW94140.1 hypothetical protein HMPREF1321_0488 [Capnocytophaga sp. oral taxon 412 str. F0487]
MNCKFLSVATFDRELKRLSKKYKSLKKDIENLKAEIEINPFLGTDLGEGYKKIRLEIASKNKGKRGGGRVITHEVLVNVNEGDDKSEYDTVDMDIVKEIVQEYYSE